MTRKVVRITQSPMNATRWCLELECGHDNWVTAKRRPTTQAVPCSRCGEAEETKGGV